MRAYFFGPKRRRPVRPNGSCRAYPDSFRSLDLGHPRRRRRQPRLRRARGRTRARHPHRRAAVARLGRLGSAHRLHGQRERDAQPARGDPPAQARCDVRLHLDEQGLRRPAEPSPAGRARDTPRAPRRTTSTSTGSRPTMPIDRCLHSLFGASKAAADLLVQEYGRYFEMPTVAFRGGCLTGPNHAGTMLHGFLSYLMRCTVTGDPLHRLRVRREAGPRQHPQRRSRPRVRSLPREPACGRGLQHRRRAGEQLLDARGDRALRADRRARARLGARARAAGRRPSVVDQRPEPRSRRDYPDWRLEYDLERDPHGDPRARTSRAGRPSR